MYVPAHIVRSGKCGAFCTAHIPKDWDDRAPKDGMKSIILSSETAFKGMWESVWGFSAEWKARKCSPLIASYCCHSSKVMGVSAEWHGTGRQHLFTRCYSTHEDMVRGGRGTSRVPVETMETQIKLEKLQEEAAHLPWKVHKKRRRKANEKRAFLLPQYSGAQRPSTIEDKCGDDGVPVKILCCIVALESL